MNRASPLENSEMKTLKQVPDANYAFFAEKLIQALSASSTSNASMPEHSEIRSDVNLIYKFYDLEKLVRYFGQRHWEEETESFGYNAGKLELENVAAHSYQVARCVSLLAPHFPWVDLARATELALLHDEPEIVTGDKDPVGIDGQGNTTHAFDHRKRREKDDQERQAIDFLAAEMRPSIRERYRRLSVELIEDRSIEAHFVKAVDKLQSLAFVRLKKGGKITPEHAAFTIRYSRIGVNRFPQLQNHFMCILGDLIDDVSVARPGGINNFCAAAWSRLKEADMQ
jgi:5'-deoxynucleotidase YfbR-like HD superfamily hydrolase